MHRLETTRAEHERALKEVDGLIVENFELLREIYRLRRRIDSLTAQIKTDKPSESH